MKKEEIAELAKKTAAQAAALCKTVPQKCSCLCQEAKKNPKQMVVAAVILVVAILLLSLAMCERKAPKKDVAPQKPVVETVVKEEPAAPQKPEAEAPAEVPAAVIEDKEATEPEVAEVVEVKPTNAVLTFTATAEKDFNYQVFYTVEREVWFDGSHVIDYQGRAGTHNYSIVLPEKEVFRIRLDFDEEPGTVTIKDIYLTGSQEADLNDFSAYELNQMEKTVVNKDGSFTFISNDRDPYMAYRPALLPE